MKFGSITAFVIILFSFLSCRKEPKSGDYHYTFSSNTSNISFDADLTRKKSKLYINDVINEGNAQITIYGDLQSDGAAMSGDLQYRKDSLHVIKTYNYKLTGTYSRTSVKGTYTCSLLVINDTISGSGAYQDFDGNFSIEKK